MYDIIIIGGNLSGTSAAINAALRDVNIALIERNKIPLSPAHCGEGIPDLTAQWLNLDGIGCQYNEINQTNIQLGSKEYILKMRKHKMIVFDRSYVENKLLEKAKSEGVELFLGIKMKDFKPPNEVILDNGEILKGKVIIDASGVTCQVGRRIGINTKLKKEDIGVCIQSTVQGDFDANVMKFWHLRPYAPLGYAWLFPKSEKKANIGLGIPGGLKENLEKLLKDYISYTTNNNYKVLNTFRSCLPLANPIDPLVKENVMLVGDAARLVNAPSGAGIGNALFSGGLAGIIAARTICGENPSLQVYSDAMQKKLKRLKKAYITKDKSIKNEKTYLKIFSRGVSVFSAVNRFMPNLSERIVEKTLELDNKILEMNKGTTVLL